MRILLVEDDPQLSKSLNQALKRVGFTLSLSKNAAEALVSVRFDHIDIVILDLGLPDMDGLELLQKITQLNAAPPVLVLTARDSLDDKITGLQLGADDYLVKPFQLEELVARLKVFERRLSSSQQNQIKVGYITLDIAINMVEYKDQSLELSKKEFLLLKALLESAGRVLTKDSLEARLYNIDDEVASNALEVHIHNLRKKTDKHLIKTIRGVGYTIAKS